MLPKRKKNALQQEKMLQRGGKKICSPLKNFQQNDFSNIKNDQKQPELHPKHLS